MDRKRKISAIKVMRVVVTVIVTAAAIVALSAASRIHSSRRISGIDINIKNPQYGFVSKAEIKEILLNSNQLSARNANMGNIDVKRLEQVITANPWVQDAQLYVDNNKVLHANISQRIPVTRIFDQSGNSYYLDRSLNAMPLSGKYIHYGTVVTNVPVLRDDSISMSMKGQIMAMVNKVERDSFWSAQVSQIVVTDDKEFEIVPVLGNHRILLGDTSDMDKKFGNLFAFYNKILNRIGWDKYEVLDLRYNAQVVASPSLPWKKPSDRMMSNMDWVKSIIDAGPAKGMDTASMVATAMVTGTAAPLTMPAPARPAVQKPEPATVIKPSPKPVANKPALVKPVVKDAKPVATKKPQPKPQPLKPAAKSTPAKAPVKTAAPKKDAKAAPKKETPKPAPKKETKTENKKETKAKETPKPVPPAEKKEQPQQKKGDKQPKYIYPGNNAN